MYKVLFYNDSDMIALERKERNGDIIWTMFSSTSALVNYMNERGIDVDIDNVETLR
mgnify:FL=1